MSKIPASAQPIISEFQKSLQHIDFVKGIYITGSIPLEDFHADKSDIDFIVYCDALPSRDILTPIHDRIRKKYQTELNGCYITKENLSGSTASKAICFQENKLYESSFEMAPVTLFELQTTAIIISGVPLPIAVTI